MRRRLDNKLLTVHTAKSFSRDFWIWDCNPSLTSVDFCWRHCRIFKSLYVTDPAVVTTDDVEEYWQPAGTFFHHRTCYGSKKNYSQLNQLAKSQIFSFVEVHFFKWCRAVTNRLWHVIGICLIRDTAPIVSVADSSQRDYSIQLAATNWNDKTTSFKLKQSISKWIKST